MARTGKGSEKARERFAQVLKWAKIEGKSQNREGKGISQAEFAERISKHTLVEVKQQYVSAYAKGREIPSEVAEAIEREFGFRAAWLLGFDDGPMTVFEESSIRVSEIREKAEKRELLFSLLADLSGWQVEPRPDIAAPFTGTGEAYDDTVSMMLRFKYFATVSRDEEVRDLDCVEFDKLLDRMLGIFDVEIRSL